MEHGITSYKHPEQLFGRLDLTRMVSSKRIIRQSECIQHTSHRNLHERVCKCDVYSQNVCSRNDLHVCRSNTVPFVVSGKRGTIER
jgi:hypothetical protein